MSLGRHSPQITMAPIMALVAVVFVGVSNGVAGGLLRDVVVRDVPALLRPGQFASVTLLAACGVYLLLSDQLGLGPLRAGWITVSAFFIVRVLTIRFNWQTGPVWEEDDSAPHP
jgi:uncharacterized membrane protein YeiH